MANYFEDPETGKKQYRASFAGGSIEHGIYSFASGATVEVPTYLSKILSAVITYEKTHNDNEPPFCDLTVENGKVTVGRVNATTPGLTFNYIFIGLT